MEEKLTIKHLAGYLPYGLKFLPTHYNFDKKVDTLYYLSTINSSDEFGVNGYTSKYIKPILHPLSDLTKEIEHNGKKFVPMDVLCSIEVSEEEDFKLYGKIPEFWKYLLETKKSYWDYWQVEKLLEWHFDIHGLIEKGLAIDINTLNQFEKE